MRQVTWIYDLIYTVLASYLDVNYIIKICTFWRMSIVGLPRMTTTGLKKVRVHVYSGVGSVATIYSPTTLSPPARACGILDTGKDSMEIEK